MVRGSHDWSGGGSLGSDNWLGGNSDLGGSDVSGVGSTSGVSGASGSGVLLGDLSGGFEELSQLLILALDQLNISQELVDRGGVNVFLELDLLRPGVGGSEGVSFSGLSGEEFSESSDLHGELLLFALGRCDSLRVGDGEGLLEGRNLGLDGFVFGGHVGQLSGAGFEFLHLSSVKVTLSDSLVQHEVLGSLVDLDLSDNSVQLNVERNDFFFWNFDDLLDNDLLVDVDDLLLRNWLVDLVDDWDLDDLLDDNFFINDNVLRDLDDLLNNVFLLKLGGK